MRDFINIDDADSKEYYALVVEDVDEVLKTMWIKEESPIDDEI